MLFFKTSNAGVEDILTVRTDGFDCVLSSLLTATYYLKIFRFRIGNYHSRSSFNTQLSWRRTFATFLTYLLSEPLRMLKSFVRHLSHIVSSTAVCVIQPSFWTSLPSMRWGKLRCCQNLWEHYYWAWLPPMLALVCWHSRSIFLF